MPCRHLASSVALVLCLVTPALAVDHPFQGDSIVLRDPAGRPDRRVMRFRATRDPAIDANATADPRLVGAAIEVDGTGLGDGSSGIITLPAAFWSGLGNPPGTKGYKFTDKNGSDGIRKIVFKGGNTGGQLVVSGGKADWLYQLTQTQTAVDVRFTVGDDVFCAQFAGTAFTKNEPGKLNGKAGTIPASCTPAICGDGTAEGIEECDDGDLDDGDGCSATCQLENTSALCSGVSTAPPGNLAAVRVASGLERPVQVTAPRLDPNRVFIVQQNGRIRILKNGVLLGTPFLTISSNISTSGERGLLGLAFHPDYESNGLFFVNYTNAVGDTVIARYQASANPDLANTATATTILTVNQDFANHNGGQIAFSPIDGYLYIGMGDGGSGGDPNERAQDDGQLLGKMLRIDVNAPTYSIPASNPHVGPGDPLDEIWAKGLRNPFRFGFDRLNGDLYIGDVGQNLWEEINYVPASSTGGEDYGWDIFEGTHCHEPTPPAMTCPGPAGYTMPVHEYCHFQSDPACDANERGCSVSGGMVYRGCAMPSLHGTYFYSDYCSAWIKTFEIAAGVAVNHADRTTDLAPGGGLSIDGVTSIGEDARGELYVTDHGDPNAGNGEVFKIVPE